MDVLNKTKLQTICFSVAISPAFYDPGLIVDIICRDLNQPLFLFNSTPLALWVRAERPEGHWQFYSKGVFGFSHSCVFVCFTQVHTNWSFFSNTAHKWTNRFQIRCRTHHCPCSQNDRIRRSYNNYNNSYNSERRWGLCFRQREISEFWVQTNISIRVISNNYFFLLPFGRQPKNSLLNENKVLSSCCMNVWRTRPSLEDKGNFFPLSQSNATGGSKQHHSLSQYAKPS